MNENNNLKDFIEYVRVPVLLFDRSLTLVGSNEDAEALLPEILHNAAAEVIFNSKKIASEILNCLNTGSMTVPEINFKTLNGDDLAIKMTSFETQNSQLAVVTLTDLTPISAARTMNTDFVANVSHEIRSPLTSINGFIETLRGPAGSDSSKRKKFLKIMDKETQRMKNLVADLLSLSLAEVKQKQRISGSLNVTLMAEEAVAATQKFAKKNNKRLKLRVKSVIPELTGDNENIRQVFINLLENSVNYSHTDSIINIELEQFDNATDFPKPCVKIRIRDKSDGIPKHELHRLTERFYRVDKSRSRNVGGTGLGLAIVKHILVRHGGDIIINSKVGKGSTFDVFLPID